MKNLIALLTVFVLITSSCNQPVKNETGDSVTETAQVASLITVKEVLDTPEKYKNSTVRISGMVTHVCRHGGQKLFIVGENPDNQLRVNVGEGISEFDIKLEGSSVEFTGFVRLLEGTETIALMQENEEKDHHTGDEPHAKAESASYFIEATAYKEIDPEL